MTQIEFIPVTIFCASHNIEQNFVETLYSAGLVRMESKNNEMLLPEYEIERVEKFVRLHFDLEINMEGLETVDHLLKKVEEMSTRMVMLENRVRFFEG